MIGMVMTCVILAQTIRDPQRNHAEERSDGGEPVVTCIAREQSRSRPRVGRRNASNSSSSTAASGSAEASVHRLPLDEPQQQTEGVTVADDGLRAGALVGEQVLGEERLTSVGR